MSPNEGSKCQIYGWSLTTRVSLVITEQLLKNSQFHNTFKFGSSPHLLSGEVIIESREKCDVTTNKITSTTLCAGPYFVNGCETDDGSPLVCNGKVHALIDFRLPRYCSEINPNRLGTYVDLSEFHGWIAEHSASANVAIKVSIIFLSSLIIKILN